MAEIKYSAEFLRKQREVKMIRKDIATARGIINDGLLRYKKKMLHARSKKQTEDLSVFAELDLYDSRHDIHNAYGYDYISENEMDRLFALWDVREEYITEGGRFEDRVSQMLTRAMNSVGEEFMDLLSEIDGLVRRSKEDQVRIERENSINSYNRYHAGL